MSDSLFNPSRLYESLKLQDLLPTISLLPRGLFDSDANRMVGNSPRTMAHEMTHAVQWNLLFPVARGIQEKKREGKKISDEESRFLEGMQKFYGDSFGTTGQLNKDTKANIIQSQKTKEAQLKQLYKKDGDPSYDSYRTSRRELEAHGVGEMIGKQGYNENMPHLNPTMAQEFDVLFSLYNSLPETVKTTFGQKRKSDLDWLKQKGYRDTQLDVLEFENILKDPFAPTIK